MKFRPSDQGRPVKVILPHYDHRKMEIEEREFDGVIVGVTDKVMAVHVMVYGKSVQINVNNDFANRKVRLILIP